MNAARSTRRATIEDVATAAGVSVATVSRALREMPNVAPSTRARVLAVAADLRYRPHPLASRLAAGRTLTVGVAVPVLSTWYFSQVVAGAEAVLAERGYDLLVATCDGESTRRRLLSDEAAFPARVDGVVLVDLPLSETEAADLDRRGVRVVTIGERTEVFSSVTIDDHAAAGLATRHLLHLGHRDIGLIWSRPESTSLAFTVPDRRRAGFLAALDHFGIQHRRDLEAVGDFTVEGGAEAMNELLADVPPPTAVVALSDEMAMGAVRMACDLGLRVPEDLSVIGFDDQELARVMGLSTVRQPAAAHGATAARLLVDDIEGVGEGPEHVVHATRLVVRATTGPVPGGP